MPPRPRRHPALRPTGFTLIELMITLAILAILVSLAAPAFGRLIASTRISGETNEFIAALNLARSESVRRGLPVSIRATGGGNEFSAGWRIFTDADANGAQRSPITGTDGTVIRESGDLNARITIRRSTTAAATAADTASDNMYIVFNARGARASGGSTFFRICSTSDTASPGRVVQVTAVGRVSVVNTAAACT